MSFFDNCIKAVKAVKKLQNTLANLEPSTTAQPSRSTSTAQNANARATSSPKADFPQLLARQFPEYEVHRNLPVAQIVPALCAGSVWYCQCGGRNEQLFCSNCGKKRPPQALRTGYADIPYVLYRDGQPKLAILLIPSAEWNSSEVVSTMAACKSAGIPCQRYFEEFSNREDYVTNRIRQAL